MKKPKTLLNKFHDEVYSERFNENILHAYDKRVVHLEQNKFLQMQVLN
jgi:hypothetical protein